MYLKIIVCGPLSNNVILLGCDKTRVAAVIDPAKGALFEIGKMVKDRQFKIEKILLTHSHWDHIAECFAFREKEFPACPAPCVRRGRG